MSPAEALECAAARAERQTTAGAAIREALAFTDRYYPGPRVLGEARHCDEAVSLAIVLARRCARPADVAEVFRRAAEVAP